jgi:pimeloyl-ACP methyl ester carboxylesterase
LARIDHRTAEDRRSADESHRTRRERGGRFRSGDPFDARLRLFGQADHDRMDSRPYRERVDRADETSGYTRFVAQGGDWGALITEQMAVQAPPELVGLHTNMPGAVPVEIDRAAQGGAPAPAGLTADEKQAYDQLTFFYQHGLGYALEMGNRPQTLYGIADSPVGLAAWILDHDARSYALITRVFDGKSEGLSRDDILDNITLYWLTKTAVSSARLYWENKLAFFAPKNIRIPVAVSAFPDELYPAPRSWAERAYPKLIHYNKLDKGGHFAAWEQPALFTAEIRSAFKSLR